MTEGSTGLSTGLSSGLQGTGLRVRRAGVCTLALIGALLVGPDGALPVLAQEAQVQPATPEAAVPAQVEAEVDALLVALRMGDTIEILREEGIEYGRTLEADMFAGAGGSGWEATVALIYDGARMSDAFRSALLREIGTDAAVIAEIRAFFEGELGRKVIGLEIEGRRAFLDDAVEEQAKAAWEETRTSDAARAALLERFVAENDLVESNVSGALNANLAFYRGMAESGAFGGEMTEDQMLSDVWAQEPEVRQSTTEWVYSYLNLSYGPLSDEELEQYAAFSATPAGQKLNTALFGAYAEVFTPISRALGLAVGRQMQGQDI